jgi:hypothetical protein
VVEVVRVGVEAFVEDANAYRERLERWNRDALAANEPDETMSDEEIEAEIAGWDAAPTLDLRYRTFAELSDGRRIVTSGDSAVTSIAGAIMVSDAEPAEAEADKTGQWLEDELAESITEDAPEPAWHELTAKLSEHGIEMDLSALAALPRSVEFDRELVRDWAARELNGEV